MTVCSQTKCCVTFAPGGLTNFLKEINIWPLFHGFACIPYVAVLRTRNFIFTTFIVKLKRRVWVRLRQDVSSANKFCFQFDTFVCRSVLQFRDCHIHSLIFHHQLWNWRNLSEAGFKIPWYKMYCDNYTTLQVAKAID